MGQHEIKETSIWNLSWFTLLNFGFGTTTNGEHHCTGVPGGTSSNMSAFTPSSNHCLLVFGSKCSQDLFDEQMYRIFGDIPNCLNQKDDIIIGGENHRGTQ
jgi:hypothetical protein